MPRICADGNFDCCVDCSGSGYAYYIKPYGPCKAECNEPLAGEMLVAIFNEGGHDREYSIHMKGITARTLGEFAVSYQSSAPYASQIYLERLALLGLNNPDLEFDILCSAISVADAIQQIAEATDNRGQEQLFVEA